MLQSLILAAHIFIVACLIGVVLLQRSEGGVLGSGGGTNSFMTGRGQANALSRLTAMLAAGFFATSLLLSIIAAHSQAPKSILEGAPAPAAPAKPGAPSTPATPGGTLLDQLKTLEKQKNQGAAPAAPAPPATPAAPAPAPAAPTPAPAPAA
ncbi:MAG: preprotein translocase subunit SecG, partial [Hyphomicrobiales bacterium]|nr:preprotein translocase subunit SecG [Hyphomicrobiales bacterium]